MVENASKLRFLQVSDVHLDCSLSPGGDVLSPAVRDMLRGDALNAFLAALEAAEKQSCDMVLIPGDLWERDTVTPETVSTVIDACSQVNVPLIAIAPGTSDYYSTDSFYNDAFLTALGLKPWPDHVRVFKRESFGLFRHPSREEVSITGRAFLSPDAVKDRLFSRPVPKGVGADFNILVFYGSIDSVSGQQFYTAPFSGDELDRQNFTYSAIGQLHDGMPIMSSKGKCIGAYAGCLTGRGTVESGPRYGLLGELRVSNQGGIQVVETDLEPVELTARRIFSNACDISGLGAEDVLAEISNLLEELGVRSDRDIVSLKLEGRRKEGVRTDQILDELKGAYFSLSVRDLTRPDYLSETFDKRTTEWKFIESMLDLKRSADAASGNIRQPGMIVEDALYYGLDALKEKRVVLRNVD